MSWSERVRRIEVHPNKVVVIRDGGRIELDVTDVRRLATCRSTNGGLIHALTARGGVTYIAEELSFKGTVWVEREETGCVVYERPELASTAKLLLELARKLREVSELLSKTEMVQLVEFYEQHKRCSTEYTWVLNPAGRKYYYWYLKCPSSKIVKSTYLGKSPGFYNTLMDAARTTTEAYTKLSKLNLRAMAEELESVAEKLTLVELAETATRAGTTKATESTKVAKAEEREERKD